MSPALAGGFLTSAPPGNSSAWFLQGGFQLEIHKWEYKPVGLSGSGFLQAPCDNIDGLSGDV